MLGRITPGSDGEQRLGQAQAALGRQGIRNPSRWVALYAPGFDLRNVPALGA